MAHLSCLFVQRRAYHFLPDWEPQAGQVHPHLLHYQLPEALLNSEKGKPGPKKREWRVLG